MVGPGLPGCLIIYQGYLFPIKATATWRLLPRWLVDGPGRGLAAARHRPGPDPGIQRRKAPPEGGIWGNRREWNPLRGLGGSGARGLGAREASRKTQDGFWLPPESMEAPAPKRKSWFHLRPTGGASGRWSEGVFSAHAPKSVLRSSSLSSSRLRTSWGTIADSFACCGVLCLFNPPESGRSTGGTSKRPLVQLAICWCVIILLNQTSLLTMIVN